MENFKYRTAAQLVAIVDIVLKFFLLLISGVVLSTSLDILHVFSVVFVIIEFGAAVKLFISTLPETDLGRAANYARFWRNLSTIIASILVSAAIYCRVRGCESQTEQGLSIGLFIGGGFPLQYLLYTIFLILGILLVHNSVKELDLVSVIGVVSSSQEPQNNNLFFDNDQCLTCPEDVVVETIRSEPDMRLLQSYMDLNSTTPPPPTYEEVFGIGVNGAKNV